MSIGFEMYLLTTKESEAACEVSDALLVVYYWTMYCWISYRLFEMNMPLPWDMALGLTIQMLGTA